MIAKVPGLAALLSLILAAAGIQDPGMQAEVKAVLGAAAGLVVAVYQWQHHKTKRNADNVSGAIAVAKVTAAAAVTPAAPVAAPAVHVAAPVAAPGPVATPGAQVPPAAPPAG